jgi:hypothetical protein
MTRATSTRQWYKVTLPAADCGTKARILQNDFETLCNINGTPNGAALFSRHHERDNQVFYFSPGGAAIAQGLIQHFSGEPCEAPVAGAESPQLVVGRPGERDLLLKSAESPRSRRKRKLYGILRRDAD